MNSWIDVHTHLNMLDQPDLGLAEAKANGIETLITIGTCPEDLPVVIKLASDHAPMVYGTLGIHPHDAKLFDQNVDDFLLEHLDLPRIVGVGEIGLDYHYDHSPRDVQQAAFRRQLEIAVEKKLPVEIHTRDAEEDTIKILKEFKGQVRGIIHCFTGTEWLAREALSLGFNLSFSGVVTFKNADSLRAVVQATPLDRLHIETDAPFLAPVPLRGQKNVPAFIIHTAEKVASLKGVTLVELSQQTRKNALAVFPKLGLH